MNHKDRVEQLKREMEKRNRLSRLCTKSIRAIAFGYVHIDEFARIVRKQDDDALRFMLKRYNNEIKILTMTDNFPAVLAYWGAATEARRIVQETIDSRS